MELRQYLAIVWKHRWIIGALFLGAVIAAAAASQLMTPVYQASTTILIKDPTQLENPFLEALDLDKSAVADYVEVLKSRALLFAVTSKMGLITAMNSPKFGALRKSVTVQPVIGTNVIKISVESTVPDHARDIANGLVREFTAQNQLENTTDARGARRFIGEQIAIVGGELARAEDALRDYKKSHRTFAPEEEIKTALDQVAKLETMKAETDIALNEASTRIAQINRQLVAQKETVVSATTISANPAIQGLKTRLADLEVELTGAREKFAEKHPSVISLTSQIEEIKSQMRREADRVVSAQTETLNPVHQALLVEAGRLQVDRLACEVRRNTLNQLIEAQEQRFTELPDKELQLTNLMRNAKVTDQIYRMLKGKYEEVRITEAMKSANVRVIDEAIAPIEPIRPRKVLSVCVAAFLGLFVGIGLAFVLEYLDTTIRSTEEAEEILGLPVLGQIPSYLPQDLTRTVGHEPGR